ncbi:MAG: AraC family transcriptional regulator [Gemmatimonadaceae bacterium]|nr:AraC family transcriptional regulator [Gemmatimonadaceae bacterium]
MDYAELAPAPALREVVRCYWFLAGPEGPTEPDPALPDGSPELIFSLAAPFVAVGADGAEREQPSRFLVGQITGPFAVRGTGRADLVGVRLEAHGATWLAPDLSALTDSWIDLAGASNGALDVVAGELTHAKSPAQRKAVLDAALVPLVAAGRAADWRVRDAVRAIRTSHGLADIAGLAKSLGTTPRSMQRLFARDVGISPKRLARMVRFQRVFAAWRADPASLARVAAECGYFDHAHLVRDFRELAGLPPASFLENQPEFTRFFVS